MELFMNDVYIIDKIFQKYKSLYPPFGVKIKKKKAILEFTSKVNMMVSDVNAMIVII